MFHSSHSPGRRSKRHKKNNREDYFHHMGNRGQHLRALPLLDPGPSPEISLTKKSYNWKKYRNQQNTRILYFREEMSVSWCSAVGTQRDCPQRCQGRAKRRPLGIWILRHFIGTIPHAGVASRKRGWKIWHGCEVIK